VTFTGFISDTPSWIVEVALGDVDGLNDLFRPTHPLYPGSSIAVWWNGEVTLDWALVEAEEGVAVRLVLPPQIGDVIQIGDRPLV
jgi:hypothetical protein